MYQMRHRFPVLPILGALVLAAGDDDPAAPPVPTSVVISPASATLTALGETFQLTATVRDQYGEPMNDIGIAWASTDETVVSVSPTGVVTAATGGIAVVTASAAGATASAAVTVEQEVAEVRISPDAATIFAVGNTVQLSAEAFDANAHPVSEIEVTWSSSDESVVTVNSAGLVTAVGSGTAVISARVASSNPGTAAIKVRVDRDALVTLYHATGGPSWANSENWLSDQPLDSWYGVEANAAGRVTRLELVGNNLVGPIPRELTGLTEIVHLSLRDNQLTGSIPPEIGDLVELDYLELAINNLSGRIPPELSTHLPE